MVINGIPDIFQLRTKVKALGPGWLKSSANGWQRAIEIPEREIILDLSNIEFVTLFEWISVMSLIERILSNPQVLSFGIDLVGTTGAKVIPANEYLGIFRGDLPSLDYTREDLDVSERVYRVAGFIEALGTRDVLTGGAERANKLFYPKIMKGDVNLRNFYTHNKSGSLDSDDNYTVVLDTTRVGTKRDCRQFLDAKHILNWREAMGRRFQESPLFDSEEVWRVLCHELAVNIYEHARVIGFIAARVVQSPFIKGHPKPWSLATYGSALDELYNNMQKGFLELCVADAGQGFITTLMETYLSYANVPRDQVDPEDILMFAFDELSTCKKSQMRWATERHALGRILQIVAKYGGAITLRSGGAEVVYRTSGGKFEQLSNHLGYIPQRKGPFNFLPGAQLQLLIPLLPLTNIAKRKESRSALNVSLPESFRPQHDQVRGHLIPLREELESADASIGSEEQHEFWEACEKLGRKIIQRPRTEPLVLDFSDLNWTSEQFETLLHLLQNVLQNRPVLLIEIDPRLAREVDDLERQSAPTKLNRKNIKSGQGAAGKSFGFSERLFLETFSRVHAPVLGLDQDGRRYLFGVSDPQYKDPLLSLIDGEASIKDLCSETFRGGQLKESHLRAILNHINCLFEVSSQTTTEEMWRAVWTNETLVNEASRAISRHFDEVAARCGAWRGRTGDLGDD
jgi:hypothetical protein